jgi:hypothetical protein
MALYKAYGNQLVDNRTAMTMVARGQIESYEREFAPPRARGEVTPFVEIGIGKPLAIEIRHVYTGEFPKAIFGYNDGMLVTSAIRSLATFNAAPRAVNMLKKKVAKHTNLSVPVATEDGTPLIYYTPALTETNTVMTVEFIFDEFPKEAIESMSKAFSTAAAIPIFAAKSTYLVAAGVVTSLVGRLGEHLFDGRAPFSVTEPLSFLRPGDSVPQQGFHLMTIDGFDPESAGCEFKQDTGELIYASNGAPYDGPHPYIVFSLDGRKNDAYDKFSATAASAALLERFYHIGEGQEQPLDILMDAVGLYNDWQFKEKAEAIRLKLDAAEPDSEEQAKLQEQYDAYVANIQNKDLKPN